MSLGDYLLPWKAIPNMVDDVKAASKTEGKGRHDSVFGAIGKYADPVGALFGDDWMEFWHEKVPREANRALEPFGEIHREYLDPIAMALPEDHKGQKAADFGEAKGADSLAAVLGAVFGGGALFGGAGGGGGGGGGFGGLNFGSMNWQDPNTYMQLAQQMPQQQQSLAQQAPPDSLVGRARYGTAGRMPGAGVSPRMYALLAQLARTRRV